MHSTIIIVDNYEAYVLCIVYYGNIFQIVTEL